MQTETLKLIIKTLENVASTDVTRHHLGCVEITQVKPGKVKVSACDGHAMSRVEIEDRDLELTAPVYIHRDKLPLLKYAAKMFRHGIPHTSDGCKLTLDTTVVSEPPNEFKYPDLDQLTPRSDKASVFKIALNAELLNKLATVIQSSTKHNGVTLEFYDDLSPIKVTAGPDTMGVVMPMRL